MTPDVLSITEARTALPTILARFREEGLLVQPVVLGCRRVPEAVVLPYALYEFLIAANATHDAPAGEAQKPAFVRGNPRLNEMLSQPGVAEKVAQIRAARPATRTEVLAVLRFIDDQENRHDLDSVIKEFGFGRADLEAELEADLSNGHD